MKKMKNVRNKMLAALVIAASMTSLCAPAYAEEAPAHAEEMYTVTEDEQGAVTIVFNEPIVLSRAESYAQSEAEEDDGIMPCAGDVCFTYFPQEYWGYYYSEDGSYTLSIRGNKLVMFEGMYNNLHLFCYYYDFTSMYFYPERNKTNGLTLTYSSYAVKIGSEYIKHDYDITIGGHYEKKDKTFVISGFTYYPE